MPASCTTERGAKVRERRATSWGGGEAAREKEEVPVGFLLLLLLFEVEGGVQTGEKGVSCLRAWLRSRWRTLEEEWSSMSSMQRGSGTTREQVRFCKNIGIHRIESYFINCSGHVSSTYVERLKGISLVVRSEVVTTPQPGTSFFISLTLWWWMWMWWCLYPCWNVVVTTPQPGTSIFISFCWWWIFLQWCLYPCWNVGLHLHVWLKFICSYFQADASLLLESKIQSDTAYQVWNQQPIIDDASWFMIVQNDLIVKASPRSWIWRKAPF